MAKSVKKSKVSEIVSEISDTLNNDEQVRIAAYYNWERTTGGSPVDEEATRNFWLEAERQVSQADR